MIELAGPCVGVRAKSPKQWPTAEEARCPRGWRASARRATLLANLRIYGVRDVT